MSLVFSASGETAPSVPEPELGVPYFAPSYPLTAGSNAPPLGGVFQSLQSSGFSGA